MDGKALYTAHAAAKEVTKTIGSRCSPQTIRALCEAGGVDCTWVETATWGRQPRLTGEAVEEIKHRRCSHPDCDEPAPGPSGKCRKHAAEKTPPEHRRCGWCGKDMGLIHGSRLEQGRGVYCSNRHKGLAHAEQYPGLVEGLNPDGAREHHRLVEQEVESALQADPDLARPEEAAEEMHIAVATLLLVHVYGGNLPGHVLTFRGSERLFLRHSEIRTYKKAWRAMGDGRRRSWEDPDHALARLEGRGLVGLYAEQHELSIRQARALLRVQVEDRHADLGRRQSPGTPPKNALRARLEANVDLFLDQAEREDASPSKAELLRQAVDLDWLDHPEDWPRKDYPVARDVALGMDPQVLPAAVDRAKKLLRSYLKSLQIAGRKTLAA